MPDGEKVEKGLRICTSKEPCNGCPYLNERNCSLSMVADAFELLKEQEEKLESVCCFENGDQVVSWHCPRCGDDIRFVIKGWNIIEDNLIGLKRIVERPQDIRVETDDGRIIVLKKEIPTMVLSYKEGGGT